MNCRIRIWEKSYPKLDKYLLVNQKPEFSWSSPLSTLPSTTFSGIRSCFPGILVNYGENTPLHVVPLHVAIFRNINAVSKDFLCCLQCFCQNTEMPINPLAMEMDIEIVAHHLCKIWMFYEPKSNVMKYTTFCRGINWDCLASFRKI